MDLRHAEGLIITERKPDRKKRRNSRKGGNVLRDNATIEREHRALTMLVKGHSQRAIAMELDMSEAGVSYLIRRALEHRAAALGPYIEQARTIIVERLERLLERWWPLATGDWVDPEHPETDGNPPSFQAATMVLKILEQLTKLTGADRPAVAPGPTPDPSTGGVHVHIHTQSERETLQGKALAQLAAMREKTLVVDGELARVGTSQAQLTGQEIHDKPGPPPRAGETAA